MHLESIFTEYWKFICVYGIINCQNHTKGFEGMRVYILASQEKIPFAEKLLEDIRNAKIISRPLLDGIITEISRKLI